ncbi:coiled-coil domain-containing protein 32 isoform X2 [Hemicordylus capensis]|uniref:coiled-coil domain-containing protein 32 isoform X2 n=1 Tax=Hemicordylus capensis TaxID=884348 RepID=UPI00230436DE|nr:coiled-coil domain-containing protein 32 isoform X2 [Hemicordylus capensis]
MDFQLFPDIWLSHFTKQNGKLRRLHAPYGDWSVWENNRFPPCSGTIARDFCPLWTLKAKAVGVQQPQPFQDFSIMIMIESVDSIVTISSQDLWAEICSSLPHPDQNEDSSNAFADSFTDFYVHVENQNEVMDTSFQANLKPWAPLNDSEIYLASLALWNT